MDIVKYTSAAWQQALAMGFATSNITGTIGEISASFLYIMKGALPTATIKAADIKAGGARAVDVLNAYPLYTKVLAVSGNTVKIDMLPYTAATASGTATWFAMINTNSDIVMYGDISDMTGTGFLKLDTTSFVSGTLYKVDPMTIKMPFDIVMS